MIESAAIPKVHLRPLTPLDYLERSAYVFREKIAVVDGNVRRTYPQLRDRVRRLATALQRLGMGEGERVAVLAPNASAILESHFAVPLAGGVLCALNVRLTVEEIDYILGHCGASVLIYDADFDAFVRELKPKAHCIRAIGAGSGQGAAADPFNAAHDDYDALLAAADLSDLEPREPDEDATLSINYTSGTTGRPKGVMYTYRSAFVNAQAEIFHANIRPESVYLWTLPLFHCNGWIFPYAVTAAGATHVCLRKVDPPKVFDLIESEKVTHMCGAPTVWIALANDPTARAFPHKVHITTAGAPPSPTIIAQMEGLGAEITHVYGLTETYGPITVCQWKSPQWDGGDQAERARLKSRQGVAMLTMDARDVRVVDSELNDVPADGKTPGEIVMRGNNVMKGYYRDPEATAKAFAGGWFHSGDVAVMQSDGYIEITDRSKDVIISGGENISTIQVEKVLVMHEDVLECAVVAMPHEKWGEVPKAFVTLKPGRTLAEEALIAFARQHLPGFKTPKAVEFGPLPKTSTGKIQKFVLREKEWKGKQKRVN
ncbi:MAG: long-chain-fatty-acid--CoA ligase [Candidatus Eremiobacteraeota bacterium]|nr:long-chain-fatty-acid--CoA ligase [Candidatus Eremiobacteraeota bacterium]MBV8355889.1 long-chain-fatty-acid--CoA ligase [Candidatus Eremiobacteraeota bacterium]